MSKIKDNVAEQVRKQCEGEIGAEVNRLLLIECYRMLELIVDYLDLDATEIREGKLDSLPMNIGFKESAMRRAYDGDRA